METRLPEQCCPTCGARMNTAAAHAKRPPQAGTLGICVYCGEYLRFKEDLSVERLPDDVFKALPQEHRTIMENTRMACLAERLGASCGYSEATLPKRRDN